MGWEPEKQTTLSIYSKRVNVRDAKHIAIVCLSPPRADALVKMGIVKRWSQGVKTEKKTAGQNTTGE